MNFKGDKTEFPETQFRIEIWLQPRRPEATVNAIRREPGAYVRARKHLQRSEPVDIDHETAFAASETLQLAFRASSFPSWFVTGVFERKGSSDSAKPAGLVAQQRLTRWQ